MLKCKDCIVEPQRANFIYVSNPYYDRTHKLWRQINKMYDNLYLKPYYSRNYKLWRWLNGKL